MVTTGSSVQDMPVTDDQLTDAMSQKHEHTNRAAVLDKLSADVQGCLLLDGASVHIGIGAAQVGHGDRNELAPLEKLLDVLRQHA